MSKTTLTFKVSTIALTIVDISTLIYFIFTLTLALNNEIILSKTHLITLIATVTINLVYVLYSTLYLVIHKKK